MAYILEDAQVRVLFADAKTLDRAVRAARLAGVAYVIAWGDAAGGDGVIAWSQWLADQSDAPADENLKPMPNLLYTSGTTRARPKGHRTAPDDVCRRGHGG